jgi:hypothetical protein
MEPINTRADLAQLLLTRMLMLNVGGALMHGTAPSLVLSHCSMETLFHATLLFLSDN